VSDEEHDRAAILARRKRWIAMAVAGLAASSSACSCACLSPRSDSGPRIDAGTDANGDAGGTDAGSEDGGP